MTALVTLAALGGCLLVGLLVREVYRWLFDDESEIGDDR
jgi:hypothetical protein